MPKKIYARYLDLACNMSEGSYVQTDIDYDRKSMNAFSTSIRSYLKDQGKKSKLVFRKGALGKIKFWRIE